MAIVIAVSALIIAVIALLTRRLDANLNQRVAKLEGMMSRLWHIETLLRQIRKRKHGDSDVVR